MLTVDLSAEDFDQQIRVHQREHIARFISDYGDLLTGTVLDYGCGDSPYREFVRGTYVGWNRASYPGTPHRVDAGPDDPLEDGSWNAILCTQVLQYVPEVPGLLQRFRHALLPGGHLVLTFATNWPEIEPEDLHRFTLTGMTELLAAAGFTTTHSRELAHVGIGKFVLALGYGMIAKVP